MRVDYLSRAHMCLSSCEMNTASNFADFMLHLEEKKEVAKVQLMVSIVTFDASVSPSGERTTNILQQQIQFRLKRAYWLLLFINYSS